jgi:hypothetical protein
MRWTANPECRCLEAGELLRTTIAGAEPELCPIHDAAVIDHERTEAETGAYRAEADRHRAVLAAFKAETAKAAPGPEPPEDIRSLVARGLAGEDRRPEPTPPTAA